MKSFAMRSPFRVQPDVWIKVDGIDDECVFFPMPERIPLPWIFRRKFRLRSRPLVEKDLSHITQEEILKVDESSVRLRRSNDIDQIVVTRHHAEWTDNLTRRCWVRSKLLRLFLGLHCGSR